MDDFEDFFDLALTDAPFASCGRCHRKTWDETEFGQEDRMTQPDGFPCGGRFSHSPA
jgi:hypothetical protein